MNGFYNYANHMLCEYATIFPTPERLVEHIFFVIGNGYNLADDGLIYYEGKSIGSYPTMSEDDWNKLLEKCKKKEEEWSVKFKYSENELEDAIKKYRVWNTSAEYFTAEAFFNQLNSYKQARGSEFEHRDYYLRPYPLSHKYSIAYQLTNRSPKWIIELALNLTQAWVRFLDEEIKARNFKVTTDGERDYADEGWTLTHHEYLFELEKKLSGLLECQHSKYSAFKKTMTT